MEIENTEEEVLDQETQPTDEELYDAEYEKAWLGEEEEVEQSPEETETDVDEPVEEEDVENSTKEEPITEEGEQAEETVDEEAVKEFAETLKWKGKEIPVTREELIMLGQKGFDAEKKWQDVASIRPYHNLIKDNELTVEQVTTLVDIVKGKNPEALALLAEQSGIDMFEAEKKNYVPKVEDRNYELDDVIAEINQNEEIATEMNNYVSSVPQAVKDTLTSKPDVLRGLNIDMQQGIAQKVMPEVIKQLAINPNQDFVTLYRDVGEKMYSKPEAEEVKQEAKPTKPKATREEKKRVAVSNKNSAPTKKIVDDYDAAWDDDEAFNKVKARLSGF